MTHLQYSTLKRVHQQIRSRWSLDDLNITSLDVLAPSVDPQFKQLKFLSDEQKSSITDEIIHKSD